MALVDNLLKQLAERGLVVRWLEGDTLMLGGPTEGRTPEMMSALKTFKKDLLARLRPEGWEATAKPKDFRQADESAPVLSTEERPDSLSSGAA